MRIFNILRNSLYSILSFVFISLLSIFVRKQFTEYLPIELLGIEGLFTNVVSILSLAELGISSVINYSLYKALASNDKNEINIIMNIYRYLYSCVGCFVLFIAVILYFFLPLLLKNDVNISWDYIRLVYFIQIFTILSTYFIAYKRSLFSADQKDYKCIKIDTICKSLDNIVRIVAIIFFKSYVLYALSTLFFNILANVIIAHNVDKNYKFITKQKITLDDIRSRNLFRDIKNIIIHKIAGILYSGSDSIIVTFLLNLKIAGQMSNYLLIHNGVYSVLSKVFQGIIPSIGNLIYTESKEKSFKVYKTLDLLYTLFGAYICCMYILFFQKFILLFFGKEFLLPESYVWLLALNVFFAMQFENACNYRNTYGSFEKDRLYMVLSAVSKVVIAMLLIKEYGIAGLMIGTIAGLAFIIYGRIIIVFKYILNQSISKYLFRHLIYSAIIVAEILLLRQVIAFIDMPLSYTSLVLEVMLATIFMIVVNIIIFYKTEEFEDLLSYVANMIGIVKQKIQI